ncbi:MAG: calcineurin-like phosphoesterase C-terminal domain-containing protein [Gemmatimonadales bacterium]
MAPERFPSRREFLGSVAGLVTLPAIFGGDPYRPLLRLPAPSAPVRVRGRVTGAGRGLARVAVSDGRTVVTTDRSGYFDLVADRYRRFVTVSVPSGYQLPTHATGTARCYLPMDGAGAEMTARFDLVPVPGGDDRHAFLALADIQTLDPDDVGRFRRETVPAVRQTLAELAGTPVFAVADGDIMWDRLALYDDYEAAVSELGIPFVQVVGNHDLDLDERSDGASTTTFERRFGPRYYSFNRGQVHYVVLDDVLYYGGGYLGYVDDDQLAWLAADLAVVEPGTPVVVFTHIPLMSNFGARAGGTSTGVANWVTNRDALYRLLEPFRTTVLTGHIHESDWSDAGGVRERNLGAVCGGWWTGDICYDGTPNGYAVVTAAGADLDWRYQATGRPADHQLRVYPRGADPTAPGEVVANVWAWEPGWQVFWYEGADRRGEMARRTGLDPLAVSRQAGPDQPAKHPWVDPVPTPHLFYAPVPAGATGIAVEAVDGRGRRYRATLG